MAQSMLPATCPRGFRFISCYLQEAYIDVVELCGILQCLGFHVKSIDTNCDKNASNVARTVIVDCRTSGLHVVLEHGNLSCSCPTAASQQNSGIWQVSAVTGGKQLDKEFGSSILGSLPKPHRERLTVQLQDIVRCIKEHNEETEKLKDPVTNRSASMIDMKTPEKRHLQLKVETPTRYRSLDTLTSTQPGGAEPLPAPGALLKHDDNDKVQAKCTRQSTYTLASTPDSSKQRNKTSSPIQKPSTSILESLIAAEKTAEELRNNLSHIIKELKEDGRYDSSSSLALDVSKISIMKVPDNSKIQFASSPNLSNLGMQEELTKRLRGVESASTSNLATKPVAKDAKTSKFRRLSPNIFRTSSSPKVDKDKQTNNNTKNSKLNSLFKPRIVTPVRAGTPTADASPNLSGSKKKYSHIKSTIPRPATAKKE